jgi:hydrogenase nickel incorporation protein HypA/HybF
MHELAIATALVEEAEKIARREKARSVVMVKVALGVLSGVEREALRFAFPLVTEGTLLSKARLEIESIPLDVSCQSCNSKNISLETVFTCPTCGSTKVEVGGGRDILIKSMELDTYV